MDCKKCYEENPERAKLCDECKADTLCEAFKMWYYVTYKKHPKKEVMTLDEAIQHAREVASNCSNKECGLEHMQLANWLEELKQRRQKDELMP